MPLLPALLLAAQAAAAPIPPPVAPPLTYNVPRTPRPLTIDGRLDDPAWAKAPWTSDFVDIEGPAKPTPKFRTRVKMLYDDQYLYVAAQLEEPDLLAKLTEHDSVIFHDNDFEVFLKPDPAATGYFEFEINALNTSWDLFLPKPYRDHGQPDNSWNIPGLKSAVRLQGTLNDPSDTDQGWTVELAFPFSAYRLREPNLPNPRPNSTWRINFSRVEWTPGKPHEDNWVWSPQGLIDMHVPNRWGYLHFLSATP